MRTVDPEAFGDFAGHQVAMLETPFARATFDVEVSPARPLVTFGSAQPLFLFMREAGSLKARLGESKTSQTN